MSVKIYSSGALVSSGAVITSAVLEYGGNDSMYVSSGGTANDTMVNSSGYLSVNDGGTANSITVNSGGLMYVPSGGTANNTTVNNWGSMYVSSGGTATNIIANSDAVLILTVAPDTYIQGTSNGSSFEIKDGKVDNYTIDSGYLHVSSGGTANSTTVNSWGSMYVSSGGTANNTTVNNGGEMYVFSGGTALQIKENGGYVYVKEGANVTFLENTFSNLVLNTSATVHSGTTAINTTVDYAGRMYVSNGGTANNTMVNSGGLMYVSSGGTATNIIANSDAVLILTVAPDTYIQGTSNGSSFEIKDGKVDNYTIDSGYLHVSSGGTADNTTVNSGGDLTVYSGGTANNTTVNSDGLMYVERGGTANNTTVNYAGYLSVSSGGIATIAFNPWQGTIYSSAGATVTYLERDANIYYGGYTSGLISKANEITNLKITLLNSAIIYSGGTANSTTVNSSGSMYVSSGGIVGGTLRTETGAVVSAYEGSIIDFTVADRTIEDDYLINDLSLIQGSPTYTITVHSSQAIGTYKLAQGAENFTGTLSIGTETENYGTITVNGDILVRNDLSYKLVQDNGDLTLGIYRFADISRVTANTVYPTQKLYLFATFNEHSAQKLYSYDQKTWFEYGKNVLVEDNVTVYFKAINGNGVESEIKSYTVTNIDKTPPTLTISGNPTEWTNQGITLNVIANDENGISRIEYSEDSGATWKTWSSRYLESGNFLFRAVDTVGNISEVSEVVVDKIDTIQPTLKGLKGLPSTWTNQDTFVTIIAEDNLSGIAKVEYRFWNEQEFTEGSSFILDKNHYGSVTVRVTDKAGNVTERIYYDAGLGFVDQIAPGLEIITGSNLETWRQGAVMLTVYASDDQSSIKEAVFRYSYENEDTWHVIGSQVLIKQNCTVYFKVTDNAGNVTTDEFTVDCLDNTAPTFTVQQLPNEATNKPVTITVSADDDLSGVKLIEYSFNNISWLEGDSFTMDHNGFYWVRVTDNAGNVSGSRYMVTNIDKIAPKINKITETAIGNGILFNGDFEDNVGIAKVQYRVNSGEYLDYNSNGIFLTYNANIKFKITDLAGNVCEEVYKIANCRELNTFASWDGNNYGDSYRVKIYSQNSVANKGFEIIGTKFECLTSFKNVEYVVYNQDNKQIHKGSVIGDDVINGSYLRASADGIKDVFLARTNGVWGSLMRAEYQGSADVEAEVVLKGKNKLCDIFVGSSDSNILFLTNDSNGDALFIDDIYSASFDNLGESNSRLAQIKEIQAGDGDDIIDLTSNKFDYSGSEMTIYGGSGNDIIWANDSVDNIIYGGMGDDTLVGGSQANTFVFEANWGNDVIYYNGTVTLNFIGVAEGDLTRSDNTISYNGNTITLINFENQDYTITYSQLA